METVIIPRKLWTMHRWSRKNQDGTQCYCFVGHLLRAAGVDCEKIYSGPEACMPDLERAALANNSWITKLWKLIGQNQHNCMVNTNDADLPSELKESKLKRLAKERLGINVQFV